MTNIRRVGVFISNSHAYGQAVLEGISTFCQTRSNWKLAISVGEVESIFQHLAGHLDGVIAGFGARTFATMVENWGKPCVDVFAGIRNLKCPSVHYDQSAIGRVGAEYLAGLGFKNFAFCGYKDHLNSRLRQEAFQKTVLQAGGQFFAHGIDMNTLDWPSIWKTVADWVAALPKPIGLLAMKDAVALEVLDACRELGIRVPDQVAVLGADNDLLLCQRGTPPISSIDPGLSRIGFMAASLLEDKLAGKPVPNRTILLPPLGVVRRASTDVLTLKDPQMTTALRYIREHACDPMQVRDILVKLSISRRSLERRFVQIRGRSLHEEIRQIQLQRATHLLSQTYLPLDQVARASGFGSAEWMVKVFRKELGMTPGEHRRRCGSMLTAAQA